MKTHTKTLLSAFAASAMLAGSACGATLSESFDSVAAPSLPAGWTLVNGTAGTVVTSNALSTDGTQSLEVDHTGSGAIYLVNSSAAFDATQSFSGTLDFYVDNSGFYSNIRFFVGDVQDGITGTAGEFLAVDLRSKDFGARANILDGAGTKVFDGGGNNNAEIAKDEWNTGTFSWTPTTGTTGDFTFSWDGAGFPGTESMTVSGYTFDSSSVFFGLGSVDDSGHFDKFEVTGTLVPEPGSLALLGLGGLLVASRRRRG